MSDSERKIFPVETVLALVSGKNDADVKEIAGYIVGRSLKCDCQARALAAFAGAWLARLYPKFADLVCGENEDWNAFVARASKVLGERISLPAMSGALQEASVVVLDAVAAKEDEIKALRAEVAKLTAEVEELKPLGAKLKAAETARDKFEQQLKDQKKDMGGLRRQVAEFQGKVALDQDELMDTIKNAIRDNLKSVTIAAGGAAAAGAAAGDAAAAGDGSAVAGDSGDEFGFGGGSSSGDEFGFGESSSSDDEFGF